MKLLEIISGEHLGKPNKGLMRVQKVENLSRCLKFLATKVNSSVKNSKTVWSQVKCFVLKFSAVGFLL